MLDVNYQCSAHFEQKKAEKVEVIVAGLANLCQPISSSMGPRNLIEEMLARIWGEVLGIESLEFEVSHIDIQANFFELGGHSLVVAQLINRIDEVFGLKLPLRRLFENPTIVRLAQYIEIGTLVDELRNRMSLSSSLMLCRGQEVVEGFHDAIKYAEAFLKAC